MGEPMRFAGRLSIGALALVAATAAAVTAPTTSPVTGAVAVETVLTAAADPVIAAAGDIACAPYKSRGSSTCRQTDTAALLDAKPYTAVLPLGDNQYYCGSLSDYTKAYAPTWGRYRDISFPVAGDNDYEDDRCETYGAGGYFTYFGARANNPAQPGCTKACKGYYSYDLGSWHLIALNSECSAPGVGGCSSSSAQAKWLEADLAAHPNRCTLAYWHKPRWGNGSRSSSMERLTYLLDKAGVEVLLGGHAHIYARYAPQRYDSRLDRTYGLRQFVVGTGGRSHSSLTSSPLPNVEVRNGSTFGILELTLRADSYSWKFIPEKGRTFTDSGTTSCHGPR
jgi:acid phosphatase type 7